MDTIKHHHIRFKSGPRGKDASEWAEEIKKVEGVIEAVVDAEKGDVAVEYDLLRCREEDIEKRMREAGFALDESFIERARRGWIRYTEENERDALRAGAPCCDYDMEKKKRELD